MDMGHVHGGGGSMAPAGINSGQNHAFARGYWFIAAGVVGVLAGIRAVNHCGAVMRLRASNDPSVTHASSTRPATRLGQAWATATAVARELSHPQLVIPSRLLAWASPPPLGHVLVLAAYWAIIVYMMTREAVVDDAFFWERIGYRNAWVSLAQLPALYLLAMKCSPVDWLAGLGHERLSWLHRWVARTMLVTATVHGFHFWAEWARADFVSYELQLLPLVKYGLAAWAVLLWNVVVGLAPVRRLAYELWLLQHVASAVVVLWLLYRHVPAGARYLIFMSVAFLVFDRVARAALLLLRNARRPRFLGGGGGGGPRFSAGSGSGSGPEAPLLGHAMTARADGSGTTVLTLRDVRFGWRPGQHVYLWVPRLGPLEAHPYTIARARELGGTTLELVVRAHAGFSRRLHEHAARHPERTLTALVSGPYGVPPRWDTFETLVLIAASTGASFTVPMLEAAAAAPRRTCVRTVQMVLVARRAGDVAFYVRRAVHAADLARDRGIDVRLHVAITGRAAGDAEAGLPLVDLVRGRGSDVEKPARSAAGPADGLSGRRSSSLSTADSNTCLGDSAADLCFRQYSTRPDLDALIREPVEQAWGETGVVVCGGRELTAHTRNCVSRLSDERAVHKGTGAQGISLHVEEFAF